MGDCGAVAGVWDSCVGYCGVCSGWRLELLCVAVVCVVAGVWDSYGYAGYCVVVSWLVSGTPMWVTVV